MRTILTTIILTLTFDLTAQNQLNDSIEINFIGSSPIITILEPNQLPRDTFGDIYENTFTYKYSVKNLDKETFLIFTGSGVYPQVIELNEIIKNPTIEFEVDSVSIMSGGMKSSERRLQMGSEIEKMKNKWKINN